jgi:hypothetical protein
MIKGRDSRLVVYFPTEKITYLDFLIQGPFKTTPNRENIPLNDPQNKLLITEIADLVAESISLIKKIRLMSVSFLDVLPIDQSHTDEIIYSTIFEKVIEKLLSDEALLPTYNRKYVPAKEAVLARGKELPNLIGESDLMLLFNKKNWLDTKITYDRTKLLRDYLIDVLDIKEVDFENFAVTLNKEFLAHKSDDWFISFYGKLLNQRSLWEKPIFYSRKNEGILRSKPIIKLSDSSLIEPFDENGKIQVYQPTSTKTKYRTVKKVLTTNKASRKFLLELGLKEPDLFAELKEIIIPKYKSKNLTIDLEEYYNDFEKILVAMSTENDERTRELLYDLSVSSIIYTYNPYTEKKQLSKPNNAYIQNEELLKYFENYDSVFYVVDEIDKRFSKKYALDKILRKMGVEDKPRRIIIPESLTEGEKLSLRKNTNYTTLLYSHDNDIDGLNHFLSSINKEKSILLWNILLKSIDNLNHYWKPDFFKSTYKWFYRTEQSAEYPAKFVRTLQETPWLYGTNDAPNVPQDIMPRELASEYNISEEDSNIIIDALGFKPDEIGMLEARTGKNVVLLDDDQKREFLQWLKYRTGHSLENEESENEWESGTMPEDAIPSVETAILKPIETSDLRGQRPNAHDNHTSKEETDLPDDKNRKLSKKSLKEIGDWGEKLVLKYLRGEYSKATDVEIIWLNEDNNIGKGYDLTITIGGIEMEYIEVKSKIDENPQFIEITGKQWAFARKLYEEREGDKYKIYIVSRAGSDKPIIKIISNPFKQWKDGKLWAHPVNLRL